MTRRSRRLRTALAFAAVALGGAAGCVAAPPLPPADGGKAYQAGYADGCSSGLKAAYGKSFVVARGRIRSESDLLYVRGWAAGHDTCLALAQGPGWDI